MSPGSRKGATQAIIPSPPGPETRDSALPLTTAAAAGRRGDGHPFNPVASATIPRASSTFQSLIFFVGYLVLFLTLEN